MIDATARTVTIDGRAVRPTRMVFELCAYLAAYPGAVRTRVQIMDAVGISCGTTDRSVDSLVARARRFGVSAIQTAHGVGYYWRDG